MLRVLLVSCMALLTSCSMTSHIDSDKQLSEEQRIHLTTEGNSTVSGQVLLIKDEGKEILFGQSTEVLLVPVCEASTDIVTQVYGSTDSGRHPLEDHPSFDWGELSSINKLTKTDNRGSFTFRKLPAGSYYILSFISIQQKEENVGSSVMRRINVDRGQIKMVSLRL